MSLVYILYVRGNSGDLDDTEYYVKHVVFAVLRQFDAEHLLLYYRSPHHDAGREAAVRELRHDETVIKNKYIGQTLHGDGI